MLWNQEVHTDREVVANRSAIIVKNREEKMSILMDMAIPVDRNVIQKDAEKKLKYNTLCIEIQQIWNMKCMITPVVSGV